MKFGEKYSKAIQLIDNTYKEDKQVVIVNNVSYPKEYLYALRLVEELKQYSPEATEEVFVAARCQHLYRWEVPRNIYPLDRTGYHHWRTYLYTYQANKAEVLLRKIGYSDQSIMAIKAIIKKDDLKGNTQSQLLEDVVCLVFLKYYLNDFIEEHKSNNEKLERIIRNTWLKMSAKGREAALEINFTEKIKKLVLLAIQ